MPSSAIERLKAERERLRDQHLAGASGLSVVRGLSQATDEAIRSIWGGLTGTDGAALVAVGGYGRGELSPYSDIDLAIVHPKPAKVAQAIKSLSYELWDAGLEFAQAVYSPKEAIKLANARVDVELSFQTARLISGDHSTFESTVRPIEKQGDIGRSPRVRDAVADWRRRGGDAGVDLEPDIKEGRGGLRDLGFARLFDRDAFSQHADFLHRVRNHLHWMTGRRTDVLAMQFHGEVATALNPLPPEWAPVGLQEENELLRNVYIASRAIGGFVDSTLDDKRGEAPDWFHGLKEARPWKKQARDEFLSLLRDGTDLWERFLSFGDALPEAFPEWRFVHCLPQRNVYHRYAVDTHSVEAVSVASHLGESTDEFVRTVAGESRESLTSLLVAALLHDIGKGAGGDDHAVEGEEIAKNAVQTMGLDEPASSDVPWLVRHHLLLSEAASRRDIADERLVVEVAEKVGDERRLRLLFLLTIADGMATGPAGWGPWRATLVSQLFTHVAHLLERGELVGSVASRTAHEREDKIRQALEAYPRTLVDNHLANMPRAWLLSGDVESLVEQSKLMLDPPARDEISLHAVPQPQPGIWELTVVASDRPGLFSKISGSLSLHGLNVVAGQIYTREDGLALEVFTVETLGDEERRFDRVREDAGKAIRGRLSLDVRLAEKRRDYAGRIPKGKQEPPQVVIDNSASDFYTVIEVHATDRVGLLHTITKALADMELDIHLAKVSTYAEDVVDVFYVRDLEGQKVSDPEHVTEIERTILHRLNSEA